MLFEGEVEVPGESCAWTPDKRNKSSSSMQEYRKPQEKPQLVWGWRQEIMMDVAAQFDEGIMIINEGTDRAGRHSPGPGWCGRQPTFGRPG